MLDWFVVRKEVVRFQCCQITIHNRADNMLVNPVWFKSPRMRMNTTSATFVRKEIIEWMMSEEHYGTALKNANINFCCTYFSREEQLKVSCEDWPKAAYLRLIGDIARWSVAWGVCWIVTLCSIKRNLHGRKKLVVTSLHSLPVAVE